VGAFKRRVTERRHIPRLPRLALAVGAALAALLGPGANTTASAAPSPPGSKTVWLCLPGQKNDPCAPALSTEVASATNRKLSIEHINPSTNPKIDCFYVYPTVSDQTTTLSNLVIDPEERSIAFYQASYYSRYCRVFAPMYQQLTLATIEGTTAPGAAPPNLATPYSDVLNAWNTYLTEYNRGRGVVFIGHSQGSTWLEQLISQQVDRNPAERKLLVSAIILGGNVLVKTGSDVGGTFQHIPACHSDMQLGCVVAYSTYDQPAPTGSLFGRSARPGDQVLCTNPAALSGGSGTLDSVFPVPPFAPGTIIGDILGGLGLKIPAVRTEWVEYPSSYVGQCTDSNGAGVLEIHAINGAPTINPVPDAAWGLHLVDAQITLGNLVHMVGVQAALYFKRTGH
jgi:hypothetical protein